jgi:Flp pilus assembly protein TadD
MPVAAPIPTPPEPTPPTIVASAAVAPGTGRAAHHKDKGHAVAAAAKPAAVVAAAPPVAAAAPPAAPAAPKGAFAEGEALFRSGDVEAALAKYQEAARANPSDAKTQRQIGKCYNRLGQRDRAQPYLKKYLELAPDAADAAFIRAMIDGK